MTQPAPSAAGAPQAAPPTGTVVRPPPRAVDYAALAAQAGEGVKGAPVAEAPSPAAATPGAETPPATEGGTPVETPVAAPLDAKAVAAAVVAGRKHQEKLRRQLEQTRRQADQTAREAQQYRQQADQSRTILDQLRSGGDPSAALQALGVSPEALARAAIDAGTPAAQVKAIQAEIAKERAAREALTRELQQRDARASQAKAEEVFFQSAQDATKYPNLSKQPRSVILRLGDSLANEATSKGERFTFGDPLESLEMVFRGGSKIVPQASVQATTGTAGTGDGPKPQTRTITNADTSSSASTPIDLKSLPLAARYKEVERRALELATKKR